MLRSFVLVVGLTSCAVVPADDGPDGGLVDPGGKGDDSRIEMTLLQANVGNVELTCSGYKYKLCYVATERRLAGAIAAQDADVISLQEVLSLAQCEAHTENLPAMSCYAANMASVREQSRRLVGDGYTIACDTRNHFECVAVKTSFGGIAGCDAGELCIDPAVSETAPPPGASCDAGFSVSSVTIEPLHAKPFRLVDLHPPSGKSVECRRAALVQVFEGAQALARGPRSLLSGDFNLDPFKGSDASEAYLRSKAGDGKAFRYHSGPAEQEPPLDTAFYPYPVGAHAYDHVISNFATGTCTTLGVAAGTTRLDGGSGTDHRALACRLSI